jgi:hypothetical protein
MKFFKNCKKHLDENDMTFWEHWRFAMSCSVTLFAHAWLPCFLKDYVSKKLEKHKK